MTAAELAAAIAARCELARLHGASWQARCPAHEDNTPSLSITPQEDKVLLHCFAGCTVDAIVGQLGMTLADLFVEGTHHSNGHKRIVQVYDYFDTSGTLVHQTVRYEPKDFKQRRPDPARPGQYIWNLQGIKPVLYNLPEVVAAVQRGKTIYVVEGEKDADALQGRGLIATCNPMGAGKWRKSYSETLRNAHVVILPDNDTSGRKHAQRVAEALAGIATSVKVVPGIHTAEAGSDVSDWLDAGGTRADFDAAVEQTPLYTASAEDAPAGETHTADPTIADQLYTDTYNAAALVREHGQNLRYCYPWKSWLVWTGTHWQRDSSGEVVRLAKQTIKRLARLAEGMSKAEIEQLFRHIQSSLSTSKLKAMIENAQSEHGIPVHPEDLDKDVWVLNCAVGTIDLKTGKSRPHRQTDLITKCLPIEYDVNATCPTWELFLWRIMGGSQGADSPDMPAGELENRRIADDRAKALIGFLQRAIGYTLTGSTREQCLFILHGPTKTGKSTFLATIRALLGPYGQQADMESFMHKDRQEVRNDLADLAGSRFVYALEGQEGRRLAESLIKQVTGGTDLLKARFLYEEYFTFKPQFKIFLGTNHKPVIKDTDSAIWERIRLVPFTVQIPKPDRDKALDAQLHKELPGILAWAVRGCLEWQRLNELKEPQAVLDANADYRSEMDDVGRFLTEACLLGEDFYKTQASVLLEAYYRWGGQRSLTAKAFAQQLSDKGYVTKRFTSGNFWLGIGLQGVPTDS